MKLSPMPKLSVLRDDIPADKVCTVCRVALKQEYVDFWYAPRGDGLNDDGEYWAYRCPSCGKLYTRVLLSDDM